MKTPPLEEVRERFKDAKKVSDAYNGLKFNLNNYDLDSIHYGDMSSTTNDVYIYKIGNKGYEKSLWDDVNGYAKILSYKGLKEKMYKITREQIVELCMPSLKTNRERLELIFPEVFETKLVEFNKWVVTPDYPKWIVKYDKYNDSFYGLNINGDWFHAELENRNPNQISNVREATEQEVIVALNKECERLGIKTGAYIKDVVTGEIVKIDDNHRYYANNRLKHLKHTLFHEGKFAEIIQALTIQEAEAKLNCKII